MVTPRPVSWLLRCGIYLAATAAVALATIVLVYAVQAQVRFGELHAWHRVVLREEAGAAHPEALESFEAYRVQEDRLFAELRQRIYGDPVSADTLPVGRYTPGSAVAELALDTPYNRSFELAPPGAPRGSVLLVHGLSDSPYSVRAVAELFQQRGYYVVALRLPGHGTLPSGLREVRWQDWYAAVVAAAKYAAARGGPGKPLYLGGHSTGAALATLYAVRSIDDDALPKPRGLYLISPAIGISPFAVLTNVISRLSFLPWFDKSRWIDVLPEYDPYKYNSFPVNAGNQIHKLTGVLDGALEEAGRRGRLGRMPRVVVFQSIVDSTITAREVVHGLLARLPRADHELVVFDVNRFEAVQGLIAPGPLEDLQAIRNAMNQPFGLTLISNRNAATRAIASYTRPAGESAVVTADLPLEWPSGVFSVGHVSLPFPPDDPVYGIAPLPGAQPGFNLGGLAVRGESGALVLSLGAFSRLRSNPFFDVVRVKIGETLLRDEAQSGSAVTQQ
ncbi:MAG TPA: alpha/beta fold hydrolase [Gammaproteobacteria bacterium]|nr:alpha/beta fold hydrolase [Gammaproteobacteria bacterium]